MTRSFCDRGRETRPTRAPIGVFARLVLLILLVLAWPTAARAAMMRHTDLTSLALESDAIVRVRKTGERQLDPSTKTTEHRVIESYKGPFVAGQALETVYDGYVFSSPRSRGPDAGVDVIDELYLFLRRAPAGDAHDWWPLASGIRLIVDGKVERFEQQSNPGPYVPIPQRRDPFDVLGDPRAGEQLDVRHFETELRRAMVRADTIQRAIDTPYGKARDARLLALAGPAAGADEDAPVAMGLLPKYSNNAARHIAEALDAGGDLHSTLDAVSRSIGLDVVRTKFKSEPSSLLAAARDRSLPVTFRVAALSMLGSYGYEVKKVDAARAAVVSLFDDPDPDVRVAAIAAWQFSGDRNGAIRKLWQVETSAAVRHALLLSYRGDELKQELPSHRATLPWVYAKRVHRSVEVRWVTGEQSRWGVKRATAFATSAGVTHPIDLWTEAPTRWAGGIDAGFVGFLPSPPIGQGTWTLDLEVVLEEYGSKQVVTRRFTLSPMTLASTAGDPSVDPAVARVAPSSSIAPKPKSCACDFSRASDAGSIAGGFALAVIALARRLARARRWPGDVGAASSSRASRSVPTISPVPVSVGATRSTSISSCSLAMPKSKIFTHGGSRQRRMFDGLTSR